MSEPTHIVVVEFYEPGAGIGGDNEDSAVEEHRRNRAVVFDKIDKAAGIGDDDAR